MVSHGAASRAGASGGGWSLAAGGDENVPRVYKIVNISYSASHDEMMMIRFLFVIVLVSLSATIAVVPFKEERRFFFDTDGWTCYGTPCSTKPEATLTAQRGSLIGQDNGREMWYFAAPNDYISKIRCAFSLQFRLAHLEFDSRGESELLEFDILIESKDNVTIGVKRLVSFSDIVFYCSNPMSCSTGGTVANLQRC
jgi:hypothetical protein